MTDFIDPPTRNREAMEAAFEKSSGVPWGPDANLLERVAFRAGYRAALAVREDGSQVASAGDTRRFILRDDGTWHMPRENPPVVGEHSLLVVQASAVREDTERPGVRELLREIVMEAEHTAELPSTPDGWTDTPLGRLLHDAEIIVLRDIVWRRARSGA